MRQNKYYSYNDKMKETFHIKQVHCDSSQQDKAVL